MEWALELILIVLLAATLFYAARLERALGVLRRERGTLEQLIVSFNTSTQQAEQGVERLRTAADGAGRQMAKQLDTATALKDDLAFLAERGEKLADRLDTLVRSARPLAPDAARLAPASDPAPDYSTLLAALGTPDPGPPGPNAPSLSTPRLSTPSLGAPLLGTARLGAPMPSAPMPGTPMPGTPDLGPGEPRLRSKAERDLAKALRLAR